MVLPSFVLGLLSSILVEDSETSSVVKSERLGASLGLRRASREEAFVQVLQADDNAGFARALDRELWRELDGLAHTVSLLDVIARRWAEHDAESMFAHLQNSGGTLRPSTRDSEVVDLALVLFDAWVLKDSERAIQAALLLEDHWEYPNASGLNRVLQYLAQHEPERARQLIRDHPIAAVKSLDNIDIEFTDALSLLDALARSGVRNEAMKDVKRRVMTSLAQWDGDRVWAWVQEQNTTARSEALDMLGQISSEPLPRELLVAMQEHVEAQPDSLARFIGTQGESLIKEDGFEAVYRWINEHFTGKSRHDGLMRLFGRGYRQWASLAANAPSLTLTQVGIILALMPYNL